MIYPPPCTCNNCGKCLRYKTDPLFREKWDKGQHVLQKLIAIPREDGLIERLVYFESDGKGDAALLCTVVAGLREKYPDTLITWQLPKASIPWIQPFSVADKHVPKEQGKYKGHVRYQPYSFYGRELQSRGKPSRLQLYCEAVENVLPIMPENKVVAGDYRGICLAPFACWYNREWKLKNWLALEEELIKQGYQTLILAAADKKAHCTKFQGELMIGQKPSKVLSTIKSCCLLIGGDTGLVHFAGLLNTPAVAIIAAFDETIFPYRSVSCVRSSMHCSPCFFSSADFKGDCHIVCVALDTITVSQVMQAVGKKTQKALKQSELLCL